MHLKRGLGDWHLLGCHIYIIYWHSLTWLFHYWWHPVFLTSPYLQWQIMAVLWYLRYVLFWDQPLWYQSQPLAQSAMASIAPATAPRAWRAPGAQSGQAASSSQLLRRTKSAKSVHGVAEASPAGFMWRGAVVSNGGFQWPIHIHTSRMRTRSQRCIMAHVPGESCGHYHNHWKDTAKLSN